jgi:hypothetical protein
MDGSEPGYPGHLRYEKISHAIDAKKRLNTTARVVPCRVPGGRTTTLVEM